MFKPGLMETVDLIERPVAARYQGFGQINASTAVCAPQRLLCLDASWATCTSSCEQTRAVLLRRWRPEWTEVQLLVYEDTRALFSVLWSDLGSPFRHIMDFVPVPQLAQRTRMPECLSLARTPHVGA